MLGVGKAALAMGWRGGLPHHWWSATTVSDAFSWEEKKMFRLFGKGPLRNEFSWRGVRWEAVRLDTDLLSWASVGERRGKENRNIGQEKAKWSLSQGRAF